MTIERCPIPVKIAGIPVVHIEPSETAGGPLRLSANFYDANGNEGLQIRRNEWVVSTGHWDVECNGPVVTVREKPRVITLRLSAEPPDLLVVERMDMRVAGWIIQGDPHTLSIGKTPDRMNNFTGAVASYCGVGLEVS